MARERKKMRRDLLLLAILLAGFLCVGAGFVANEYFGNGPLFVALAASGILLIVGSAAVLYYLRYSCPECGKGRLRPVARPEDGIEVHYDSRGNHRIKIVSQFYDCDACGHREWIEH